MKLVRPEIEIKNTKIVKSLKRTILINVVANCMTLFFLVKVGLVLVISLIYFVYSFAKNHKELDKIINAFKTERNNLRILDDPFAKNSMEELGIKSLPYDVDVVEYLTMRKLRYFDLI